MDRPNATSPTPRRAVPTDAVAADQRTAEAGVTQVLASVLALPAGAVMVPDGTSVRLDAVDTGRVWTLVFGHVSSADHALLTGYDGPAQVSGTLFGTAQALEAWAWGRAGTDVLEVEGDPAVVDRLRRLVDEALRG